MTALVVLVAVLVATVALLAVGALRWAEHVATADDRAGWNRPPDPEVTASGVPL